MKIRSNAIVVTKAIPSMWMLCFGLAAMFVVPVIKWGQQAPWIVMIPVTVGFFWTIVREIRQLRLQNSGPQVRWGAAWSASILESATLRMNALSASDYTTFHGFEVEESVGDVIEVEVTPCDVVEFPEKAEDDRIALVA